MCFVFGVLSAIAIPVQAADHFLTIGGGYSPTGNQISLEKNVQLFQQLLAERYSGGTSHDVYFSDGKSAGRDLQFHDPALKVPRANLLLARVFRQTRYLPYRYRTHAISDVKGETNRANLDQWFQKTGSKLRKGDRLFVYVTAHGGSSRDRKNSYNTGLYLWNTYRLAMTDFATMLDKVSPDVPVAIVMVQCYSGGFANLVFQHGDANKGLAKGNRCGFFATVHTRPAAGCTPDINEDNYREYSTYFWEAIRGKTRTGATVNRPDYNGDGKISFDEAHAFALLTSNTIDISVATSDRFLRIYSRTKSTRTNTRTKRGEPVVAAKPRLDLLTPDMPFDQLLKLATPAEQAVLTGLSTQLKLKTPKRHAEATQLAAKILKEKRAVDADSRKKGTEYGKLALEIRKVLLNRWPEMNNLWHPDVAVALQKESAEVVKMIESHKSYKRFEQLRKELTALDDKSLDHDRRWAKTQRLIRSLENIALAANLPKVARPEIVARFKQLRELESISLPEALQPTKAGK